MNKVKINTKKSKNTISLSNNSSLSKIDLLIQSIWKPAIILLVIFNLFLCSWYVLHEDLNFHTDISRDFLLLNEIENKKIVLIGARSGAAGFFHGPLWMYFNYPVYFLSNGNPVASGWFWIFLIVLILISGFFIFKKIFDDKVAYLYLLLMSSGLIYVSRDFTHPQMSMLVMPFFFFTFIEYVKTFKLRYLALHVLLGGILIQLEIACGGPFMLLTFLFILYQQYKACKLWHLIAYFLLLIPLSTYIIFDLRHNFFLLKNLITYIKGNPYEHYVGFMKILKNRLEYMTFFAMPLLSGADQLNRLLSIIFNTSLMILIITKYKFSYIYKIFFYLFFGFFLISLKSRYYLLIWHFQAFIPIVLATIASVFTSKYAKYFVLILLLIIVNNEIEAIKFIRQSSSFTGINESSWKFYSDLSKAVFNAGSEKEFGYFIYTPDKLSYSPKYALIYGQKTHPDKKAYYFQKKPITYVVVAPPPKNDPYMLGDWWTINTIKINKKPTKVINFPNGYKIERYELTSEEIKTPFDPTADTGIHFR